MNYKTMTEEGKFRDWMLKNYGVQDAKAYYNTQTEELAIQYSQSQNSELLDKVRRLEDRIHELENPFHDLRT